MRKSVFKVLALLCITLVLLFCLSFLKADTEYMVANSEGDYGKAGAEQRLEVQNTEAEEKDTILSEKKELGAKKYEVTAERKTSILGKKEADEKITGLEEQEEKISEEEPGVQLFEIVLEKTMTYRAEEKSETSKEELKVEEPEMAEEKVETSKEELKVEEPEMAEEKAETSKEELKAEEPAIAEEKVETSKEELKAEEPAMAEEKAEASKEELKAEEPAMAEEKVETSKEELKAEEPAIAEEKVEASKEELKEEPKMAEEKVEIIEEELKEGPKMAEEKVEIIEEEQKEEPEMAEEKVEIIEEEQKEEPKTAEQETETFEENQKVEAPEIVDQEAEEIEFDTAILEEKEQEIQISVEQLNTEKADEGAVESKKIVKYDGDLTKIISNEGKKLTIEYLGPHWVVNFAIFKCDTTKCVGFEGDAKSRIIEGRRGGCTVDMLAPEALDGYEFVRWEKSEEEVGKYNSKVDVYTAIYKEVDNSKKTNLLTTKEYVKKQEVSQSNIEEKKVEEFDAEEKEVAESSSHQHVKQSYEHWTRMTSASENREITVHYEGCHCYVSFAKFTCDTTMCDGFGNNGDSQMIGRRGGCEVTVKAPKAKEGYKFKGWKQGASEGSNVDTYEAVYEKIQ